MDGNTSLLRSMTKNNSHVNMNMNSVKETIKKTNKSPAPKSAAELSSPATPPLKNAPNNSPIDVKKVLAPKPVAPVSMPAPAAAKVSTIAAKVKDASTPAPQSFALLAERTPAPVPKAVAVEAKKLPGQKSAVSAPRATTIEAKIDVGFGNALYLRGQGPGLSWERGVPCECVNRNTWRWTAPTATSAEKLTFKLLLNDSVWARGADLVIGPGEKVEVVPAF
jgi:hypothetical protein